MTYNNKIIAWAKETGKKLRISTYDMTGEEGWVPLIYANNDAGAMNKAKNEDHTPGPWFIERRTNDVGTTHHSITASEGGGWANDRYMSVSGCIDEHDARLIAAAPDLLKALIMCCQSMSSVLPDFNPFDQAAYDKARAAIAKATGAGQGGGEQ